MSELEGFDLWFFLWIFMLCCFGGVDAVRRDSLVGILIMAGFGAGFAVLLLQGLGLA